MMFVIKIKLLASEDEFSQVNQSEEIENLSIYHQFSSLKDETFFH